METIIVSHAHLVVYDCFIYTGSKINTLTENIIYNIDNQNDLNKHNSSVDILCKYCICSRHVKIWFNHGLQMFVVFTHFRLSKMPYGS